MAETVAGVRNKVLVGLLAAASGAAYWYFQT